MGGGGTERLEGEKGAGKWRKVAPEWSEMAGKGTKMGPERLEMGKDGSKLS